MKTQSSTEAPAEVSKIHHPTTTPLKPASPRSTKDSIESTPKTVEQNGNRALAFLYTAWKFCLEKVVSAFEWVLWAFGFREEEDSSQAEAAPPKAVDQTPPPPIVKENPLKPKLEEVPPLVSDAKEEKEPPKANKLPIEVTELINNHYEEAGAQFVERFDEKMAALFQVILSKPEQIKVMRENNVQNYKDFCGMVRTGLKNEDQAVFTTRLTSLNKTIDKLSSSESVVKQFQLFFKPFLPFFENNPSTLGRALKSCSQQISEKLNSSGMKRKDLEDLKQFFGSFISTIGSKIENNPNAYVLFISGLANLSDLDKILPLVKEHFPELETENSQALAKCIESGGYLLNAIAHPQYSKTDYGLKDPINIKIALFKELIQASNDKQLEELILSVVKDKGLIPCLTPIFKEIGKDQRGLTRTKDSLIEALNLLRALHHDFETLV